MKKRLFVLLALLPLLAAGGGQYTIPGHMGAAVCALPFTDTFSGTGALGSCWTSPMSSNWLGTVTRSSGYAAWTSGSNNAMALYTGSSIPAAQSITVVAQSIFNGAGPGPVLRGNSANGNAYWWRLNAGVAYYLTSGAGVTWASSSCPAVSDGDTVTWSVNGGYNFTCKNVTTGLSNTFSDPLSTYATGAPGILFLGNLDSFGTSVISSP